MTSSSLAQYADDTPISCQSWHTDTTINRLQTVFDIIMEWCTEWEIATNGEKKSSTIFKWEKVENIANWQHYHRSHRTMDSNGQVLRRQYQRRSFGQHRTHMTKIENSPLKIIPHNRTTQQTELEQLLLIKSVIITKPIYTSVAWGHTSNINFTQENL